MALRCSAAGKLVAMVRSAKTNQQQGLLPEQDCLCARGSRQAATSLQAKCSMLRGLIKGGEPLQD